ncbi:MAG: ATP-binding cassette domain-containing protein, partial [Caulobacteraceae bacterium]
MTDSTSEQAIIDGRPGAGAALVTSIREDAGRRPKSRDVRNLGNLIPFMLNHWGFGAGAFVFLIISVGATLGVTGAAKAVVDEGFLSGGADRLNMAFIGLGAVALTLAVSTAFRFYFITRLGERVVADVRKALYSHILTLDPAFFLKTRTGEVLSRMTTDITLIETLVGSSISISLRNLFMLIGATILLAHVSWQLTLFVMMLGPVVILPMFIIGRRVRKLSTEAQDSFAEAVAYAGESLDALETVQAFGREKYATSRFGQAVEFAFGRSMARIQARATMTLLVMGLIFGGVTVVLWVGARQVVAGEMTAGTLLQFVILSVMAASSVGMLGETWGDVQKASGAMQRISELLAAKPNIAAPALPTVLPAPRGEVAFEDVTFAYPGRPDLPALRGLNLHVKPGETVALVGPSGAGKSTVFR